MSDFRKVRVTFLILKLEKCDAYQNGVELCHKLNVIYVKWPSPLFFLQSLGFGCWLLKRKLYDIKLLYLLFTNILEMEKVNLSDQGKEKDFVLQKWQATKPKKHLAQNMTQCNN